MPQRHGAPAMLSPSHRLESSGGVVHKLRMMIAVAGLGVAAAWGGLVLTTPSATGTVGTVAAASHWVNTQEQQWTETRQKLIHYNWLVVTGLV